MVTIQNALSYKELNGWSFSLPKIVSWWVVVVVQLAKWSILIPEVRSLNPVIGKINIEHLFTVVNCIEMTILRIKMGQLVSDSKLICSN